MEAASHIGCLVAQEPRSSNKAVTRPNSVRFNTKKNILDVSSEFRLYRLQSELFQAVQVDYDHYLLQRLVVLDDPKRLVGLRGDLLAEEEALQ